MDNRQFLLAGVVAPLVLLAVVLSYYLLVYVPARDAREAGRRAPQVAVQTERPPGALSDGDGFRPSVIEDDRLRDSDGLERFRVDPGEGLPEDAADGPMDGETVEPADAEPARPAPSLPTRTAAPPAVDDFAAEYLARQGRSAVSEVLGLYATTVRYYDRGRVDASAVQADKEAYYARFPRRSYRLDSPVRLLSGTGDGPTTLRFDYTYALGGAGAERAGRAWAELDVVPSGGTYLIQGERGDVY